MRKRGSWFNLGIMAVLALSLFTLGCDDSDSTVDPNVTVSGFVVDGPIVGVHVEVVDADGNIYRSSDPTDERGWYAVQVSRGAGGPLRVRTVGTAGDFNAVYHSILKMGKIENDRSDVHLTPMTTLIYFTSVTVAGGDDAAITAENVDAATVQVKALFSQLDLDFDPLSTTPVANEDMDDDDLTAVLSYRTAISALLGALDGDDDDGDDEEFGMSGAFPAAASALAQDLLDGASAVSAFKTRLVRAFSIVRVETLAAMIGQEAETLFEITIDLAVAAARVTEKAEPPAFFTLNVVHVNDTHSHLDPTEDSLYFDGVQTYLEMGGYARLATEAATVRAANPNTLVLHAGDAVQGTLYFTQYDGVADLDLLNRIGFDAMAVGNHEFDRGPGFLAGFIDGADFPLLGANIDASADPNLNGKIAPYAIETLNGEKIGIIGLITPETRNISSPGDNIVFLDQAAAARNAIADLEARGVDKIIVLSHMSFELDKALAQTVEGIDIIVGGHSHTLLGDMEDLGKSTAGDYPVEIEGPNGDTIYIVHSWEWAKAVGSFEARFDGHGRVIAFDGAAALLVGDEFRRKDADGDKVAVDAAAKDAILAAIAAHPAVKVVAEDADLLAALAPYAEGIDDLQTEVIAAVSEDLLHIREPGQHTSGADLSGGSLIAPIVSEGMLWKANDVGLDADMAFQNAGGVRIDIPQGDLTVGTAYELLPFGNTMVALDLTGAEIRAALENGVERSSGAWPYVAGARYTVDVSRPEGQKIVSVEIMMNGAWVALDETAVYRIVTNSYIASGGDGYGMLADAAGYRYDTGFVDAEVFMAYAEHLGTLTPPQTTYIVYMDGGATAEPRFAVFSDPHYFDPDLLINDGAAFQEYLARDRKLLKESEAILASTVDAIKNTAGLDFVLVPGDMTKDGAKTSHRKFANHIQTLENAGIPVYVVPGNHDIDNPHAHAYDGDAAIEVDTVSPTEFARIYNDYGYGEAIARDPASLGYVAEPVPGLWLLALDSCRYAENDAAGKAVTGGRFSTETLNWITDRLAEAQAADKQVIAMMHHGLLEHFTGQSQANPGAEYVIENWETVSQTLAEAGLPVVFTGHFHAQDVAVKTWEVNGGTIALTDVQTGSLVTYPNPYRIVDMKADGTLDIDSRYITEVDYDTGFMTFPEYAENYLLEGLNGLVYASLTMPADQGGYGLPAEQANALTPMIVAAFAAHYAGNESPDAETLAAVNDMLASDDPTTQSLGQSLYVLWVDDSLDVNVILHLDTGDVSSGESPIHQYRLVWTDDPATTMTVGFGQMDGADPYVKFGTTADLADAMTQETIASTTYANPRDGGDPDKVLESYFAKLTGLTPDTAYHFQVCNSVGCGGTFWFRTAPDVPADFTFVAGGDTRTNETPRRHGNMLIAKIRPLFIAHGGDYMNDGTYDEWVQWLDEWQSTTSGDGRMYPVLPCHGNHENDVTDMMARIFNIPNPDAYYALNIAGDMMRLYTLNTELEPGVGYGAFDGQDATQWNQQAEWFAEDIADYRDSVTWLVANYHRPLRPHTSGKAEGTGRIAAWADAFYDNGLDLAVECDTHMVKYTYPLKPSDGPCSYQDFARDDAAGTVFIGEGSWGAPTRPTDDDKPWTLDSDSFWQFKVIHASPDALDIRTVKFGSQEDAADGIIYDPSAVTALTQAEQDADPFAMPAAWTSGGPLPARC